jgi:hypothetical protein
MTTTTRVIDRILYDVSARGRIWIENGRLLVSPASLANLYAEKIREFKQDILIHFAHCPICASQLTVRIQEIAPEKIRRHSYCPAQAWHYDKWER